MNSFKKTHKHVTHDIFCYYFIIYTKSSKTIYFRVILVMNCSDD